jgi:hypothetical protein
MPLLRTLTPEEVKREVQDILTRPWPRVVVLPLKSLEDPMRLGFIVRTNPIDPNTISSTVLLQGNNQIEYESLWAMVQAGWIVD